MKSAKVYILALSLLGGWTFLAYSQEKAPPEPPAAKGSAIADKYGAPDATVPTAEPFVGGEGQTAGVVDDELIYLNATDVEIKDLVKQISKATGTNFILDDKLKGKITIISEKPMTKDMAYQAFLSALQVSGFTTVKTPGGLLKIVQTKDVISEPVDIYKDETPNTDRFVTRILQVKNISANELASVIKSLVSKNGNLFAYPATNSLIITDAGSNIERILKIIHELDQEGPQEVIEIIPIQHADAKDITEKISQLFENETQGASKKSTTKKAKGGGGELEDSPTISKVIEDERTNSIIILGSKRAIVKVRALIARLDSPMTGAEGSIHVYYLRHANAKELAEVMQNLVSDSKDKKKDDKTAAGAVNLEGGVKVTADEATNSIVITASAKDYETLVQRVVAKLDIPRRQVFLEAVIMELTVQKDNTFGASGNAGNIFNIFGAEFTGFGGILPLTPAAISSIASAAGGLAGGLISSKTIDFTLSDGSTTSIPAASAILQALQTDSNVNVLSTPSILTMDNEEAQIQIGQEVPTPSGTTVSSGVTTFNVTREDTGIILKISPQISESDTIRLKLSQEVTNVISTDVNLGPTLTKRAVDTVVVAHDKQTVVMGGLIDDQATSTVNKIPLLGDIPVLGNFFKNKATKKVKTNIVIFITPYIIRERADYLAILQKKIEERNLFIDLNYGKSQRKQIRETIRNHAHELLEYKTASYQAVDVSPRVLDSTPRGASSPMSPQSAPSSSGSSAPTTMSDSMAPTAGVPDTEYQGQEENSSKSKKQTTKQ